MKPENERGPFFNFGFWEALVTIGIILALAGLSAPVVLKSKKCTTRTEALNNVKQLSTMLFEFDADYGSFPDDETALEVRARTKSDFVLSGQYSNDYFRQMLADGKEGKSERPFWCKTSQSPKRPDEKFSTAATALAAGEVGFSYIMASPTQGQSASGKPERPMVVAPSDQFRADWSFDPEPFCGKAVVLRLDNSATAMQIREDNRKVSTGVSGKTLGDSGEGTVWSNDSKHGDVGDSSLLIPEIKPVLKAPQPR